MKLNWQQLRKLLIASLIVTAFALTSNAQIRLVESLPDGSHVVEINGAEFRALGAAKMRELQKQKAELEATKQVNGELSNQTKEAVLQRDLAQAQRDLEKEKAASFEKDFNRAREDAARFHALFMSERELRIEASQFVPHGSKTKLDKVLAFFDRPATVSFFKIGLPLIQTWRCK